MQRCRQMLNASGQVNIQNGFFSLQPNCTAILNIDILFLLPPDSKLSTKNQFTAYVKTHVSTDSQMD